MELATELLLAGCGILAAAATLMWLFNDSGVPAAIADQRLHPRRPRKRRPDNRIGATRRLLEAFLADLRRHKSEAELVAMMPVMIAYAYLPRWMSDAIPLDKPIGGWLLRYEGGRSATAVATDGTQLRLDAHAPAHRRGANRMLALVRVAGGAGHIIHVRAKRQGVKSHFRAVGFGRFRIYKPTGEHHPDAKTIHSEFLSLEGA